MRDVFGQFIASKQAQGLSPETIADIRKYGRRLCDACPVFPPAPGEIDAMLAGASTPVVRRKLYDLTRSVCRWARMRYSLNEDPTDRVLAPKRPKADTPYLSLDEMAAMFRVCVPPAFTVRDRAMLAAMFGAGLRVGEVVRLTYADIGADVMRVPGGKTGPRRVPTPRGFYELALTFGRTGFVFRRLDRPGQPISPHTARQIFARIAEAAGLPSGLRHSHIARHTFARWFLRASGNIESVRLVLGHTTLQHTLRYTHAEIGDVIPTFNDFNPLNHAGLAIQLSLFRPEREPDEQREPVEIGRRVRPARGGVWRTRLFDLVDRPLRQIAAETGLHHTTLLSVRDGWTAPGERFRRVVSDAYPELAGQLFYWEGSS